MLNASELMNREVHAVHTEDTLAHAKHTMLRYAISYLVCVDGARPVGMITPKDIVTKLYDGKTP